MIDKGIVRRKNVTADFVFKLLKSKNRIYKVNKS